MCSRYQNAKITAPDQVIPFESVPDDAQKAYRRQFWLRSLILGLLVFFGYQTPSISRISSSARREKVQDFLFGVVLGAINGYLIVGTIWSYMHSAHYPFAPFIISPNQTDPLLEVAGRLLQRLPPAWLGVSPFVYAAVVAAFLFVLVVFI